MHNATVSIKIFFISLISLLFYSESGFAWQNQMYLRTIVSVGVGSLFSNDLGNSQYFANPDPLTDQFYQYSTNRRSQTSLVGDIYLAEEFAPRNAKWFYQLGVGYSGHSAVNVNGDLTQGADVFSEDAYTYHYAISTNQLLALGKVFYNVGRFHPFALVGLGVAFNRSYNFTTSAPPFIAFTREYASHSTTSFSYALGLGVDVDVVSNLRIGVGYRFNDYGRASLGSATVNSSPVSGTLSQTHLYANELLAQVSVFLN